MDIPKTMKALKSDGKDKVKVVTDAPVPEVPEGYVLAKVNHVALNPTDWKHLDYGTPGLTVGCDFSGTVVKVSESASKSISVGDHIAGYAHGQKPDAPDQGCFAEYALVKAALTFKVPAGMSSAVASTLPLGLATIGQALYQRLNLPWPDQVGMAKPGTILIYGGSTATGVLAIQFAKLSGWRVLTTCSPSSFERCRALGADETFDYKDADACVAAVRASTAGSLLYAFDCVGSPDALRICAEALTQEKGRAHLATISPFAKPVRAPDDVWQKSVFAYTSEGETFHDYGMKWEAKPLDHAHGSRFFKMVQGLVDEGKIKSFPVEREGGLSEEGIVQGLDDLRNGRVRAGKLVYRID